MPDNPPRLTDPPPPPRAIPAMIATVVFNVVGLVLLLLGQVAAGEVFVGLAIVSGLVAIFSGRSGAPGGTAAGTTGSTVAGPTGNPNPPQPNRPAQNG